MSASPEFIAYVQDLFRPLGPLDEGTFFGGFAFKHASKQFAMIMGNTLYFCVNDVTRPKYEVLDMQCFSYDTKKGCVQVRRYFTVPEALFEAQDEFLVWAKEAMHTASLGKVKKRKRNPKN